MNTISNKTVNKYAGMTVYDQYQSYSYCDMVVDLICNCRV